MADQPSWMSGAAAPGASGAAAGGLPTQAPSRAATATEASGATKGIRGVFHVVNAGLAVFMACSAVYGLLEISDGVLADFFLSIYLLMFAAILFIYETSTVCAWFTSLEKSLRRNFGYFYGTKGRGLYLVFVGFLNFGLDSTFSTWCGISTIVWGVLTVGLFLARPETFEDAKPST